jgi:hypothetical protein
MMMMTTMMTMTTTTTLTIPDETPKSSDEFYVRKQQVMGTKEKITSECETLTDNLITSNIGVDEVKKKK